MKFKFPAQYDYHRGPDAIGQHKFTFDVDESRINEVGELMKTKKGTEFMMAIESVIVDDKEIDKDLIQETPQQTLTRFRKRFHSLMSEVADMKKTTPEKVKEAIKKRLVREGKIEKSTKEMTVDMLSVEINNLDQLLN